MVGCHPHALLKIVATWAFILATFAFLVSYVYLSVYRLRYKIDRTVMRSLLEGTCCRSDLGQAAPPAAVVP